MSNLLWNFTSVLAQLYFFGINIGTILGILLTIAGVALYFLRTMRPDLSRSHDIFLISVSMLVGFILMFQGWRLDPILLIGQLLLIGIGIAYTVESIQLRRNQRP